MQTEDRSKSDACDLHVLFVTRDTVVHAFHGAITAIHNLLGMLQRNGMQVTVLVTGAVSRSPRLFFREAVPLPRGVHLRVPGYWRFGRWYVRPLAPTAWARVALRALQERPALQAHLQWMCRAVGVDVFAQSWDLTEPTAAEARLLGDAVATDTPCTVIANYAMWGPVLGSLRAQGDAPRTLILMHDLLAEHVRGFAERGLPLDCNPITPELETVWLNGAESVIAIQEDEAATVRTRTTSQVLVQPIVVPAEAASATPEPLRCLFVGSNSPPNVEGLEWVMREVWPRVRALQPGATLAVAGSVCGKVTAASEGVLLLGHVDSLAEEHRRAAVCLVPLLVGSGLKIKLLDALSYGKATVSTSVGVQGVEAWVERAVAVANEPESFAAEVARLLGDAELRRERERAAAEVMRLHFAQGNRNERALLQALGPR